MMVTRPSRSMRMNPLGVKPTAAAAWSILVSGGKLKAKSSPPPKAALARKKLRRERLCERALSAARPLEGCNDMSTSLGPRRCGKSRSLLDRLADADIGAAATDVAGHRCIDISIGGLGISGEQRSRGHDLPRLTITALDYLEIEPCLLKALTYWCLANRFDRGDGRVTHVFDRHDARAQG